MKKFEVIKEPRKSELLDMNIRMIKMKGIKHILYIIEYFDKEDNEWDSPDYGVGSSGWTFIRKKEALSFWEDLFKLSSEQMGKKYEEEGRWVD